MSTPNPVDDRELTEALEELVIRLADERYGKVAGELSRALQGSADDFLDSLARHLLFEEEVLFPAILRGDQTAVKDVRSLLEEHGRLRKLAAALERAIKTRRREKGHSLARLFLAELYAHMDREAHVMDCRLKEEPSGTTADRELSGRSG